MTQHLYLLSKRRVASPPNCAKKYRTEAVERSLLVATNNKALFMKSVYQTVLQSTGVLDEIILERLTVEKESQVESVVLTVGHDAAQTIDENVGTGWKRPLKALFKKELLDSFFAKGPRIVVGKDPLSWYDFYITADYWEGET